MFLFFVLCFFISPSAYCQRQTSGRPSVDLHVNFGEMPFGGFGPVGGRACWSQYQYRGHTSIGVDVSARPWSVVLEEVTYTDPATGLEMVLAPEQVDALCAYDAVAGIGYYYRLLSPRSRWIILSAGVFGGLGVRYCNELTHYYHTENNEKVFYDPVGFLMKLSPELLLEVYPFDNLSLFVSAYPNVTIIDTSKGDGDWFVPQFGAGVKIYL